MEEMGECGGGDSATDNGVGNESGEVVLGILEGPASEEEMGMWKGGACFIDSLIAFSKSCSSLESCPECSLDSFSERAIARASSSSSFVGARLMSPSRLGGELVGNGGGGTFGGGGPEKDDGALSYGEL